MINPLKKVILCSLLITTSISSYSASFNCNKASTWVEKSICANSTLSHLDERIDHYYRLRLKKSVYGTPRADQRQWLKHHRNTCKTVACLKREHQEYIREAKGLELRFSQVITKNNSRPRAHHFGKFTDNITISVYQGKQEGFTKSQATNTLTLKKVKNKPRHAVLNAQLIFTNAHSCTISNKKVVWSENHWKLQDRNASPRCELRAYPHNGKILLQDINSQCRKTMCGMRGYLDGLTLQK